VRERLGLEVVECRRLQLVLYLAATYVRGQREVVLAVRVVALEEGEVDAPGHCELG